MHCQRCHTEGPLWSTDVPCAAVCVLLGLVHVLTHRVFHRVLVLSLEPREGFQHLNLLLHYQLVDLQKSKGTILSQIKGIINIFRTDFSKGLFLAHWKKLQKMPESTLHLNYYHWIH